MFKMTFHSDEPLIKDHLLSCTSEFCQLTSISLNYTIMVSFRSIRRRDIRRQETASVKDFRSYTSKKNYSPGKLTTVLLNGNLFSPDCCFLRTCDNRVSKVVSCFNLETVVACPNFRSRLLSCEVNKHAYKQDQTKHCQHFREICTDSNNTLYLHNLPVRQYSLRYSLTPLLIS